jgi:hypothetical protein
MEVSQVAGIEMGRARWRRPVAAIGGLAVLGGLIATAPPALGDPQDPAPPPAPPGQAVSQSAADGLQVPPNGMPHLSSPNNLPPDTTDEPVDTQSDKLNYLREVWHAIQDQDITPGQGLLAIAQQPMDATPQTGMPINPQPPPGQ